MAHIKGQLDSLGSEESQHDSCPNSYVGRIYV